MADNTVIVIGAGLAGLSAGCYLRMNGYRTRILEQHSLPGGVASAWRRNGYIIDGGIHFLMGHKPGTALHDLYRELGTGDPSTVAEMDTYGRFVDETTGRSVTVTRDLERLARDLKALSPGDAAVVDELVDGARALQGLDLSTVGMSKPPELSGPLDTLRELWSMRRVARYMTGKYGRSVEEYVQRVRDPWLQRLVENLFLPEVPAWFVLMVLALLADGQLGMLLGGCNDFVGPIERRYRDLGGEITYRASVEQILVEHDHAVGVRLADGEELRAGAVVSAADGHRTIFHMLGGRYVNDHILERYKRWTLIRPMAMASFAVRRSFAGEPWMIAFELQQPIILGRHRVPALMLRLFNYSDRFAPPGRTVVQASFETEWDFWSELHRTRNLYRAEKERVASEILSRLDRHYPGIASQVEMTDVATPYTTWRYTRNHRGAYMGWLPTPQALTTRIERTLPGLRDFYMAGQWVMPGGGVPPCLYSGRHVAQMLCRRDGKRFEASR